MKDNDIHPLIKDGQPFMDEPIMVYAKRVSIITQAVHSIYGHGRLPQAITIGHNRVKLRWMKPDSQGGLIPR